MLQFMRNRASSWMIKGILLIIVLAFIFMGVGNFRDRNDVAAATVNGKKISLNEFQDRYYYLMDDVRRQFGNNLNDDILGMLKLKEQAMEQLISETLLLQKSVELGFQVSDQELSDTIRQMSYFQQDGRFNHELYGRILERNRMTPEMFEQKQRQDMLTQKVRQLIIDSVKVSEDEARRWYDWQNTEIKIKAAVFKPEKFVQATPSEEALEQYFDENKEKYKAGEKTRITYMPFNPDNYTESVTVEADEIQQYYDDKQDTYRTEKTIDVSHILIKVDEDAPEATVSAKQAEIMEVYEKVTSGQDFADCAREYSEDTSSSEGGVLGVFKKEELVPAFAEKAFSMEVGEISEPVLTQFGWHIIKLDKINAASVTELAEVKQDIRKALAIGGAREMAYDAALSAFDAAINSNSIKQAAEQLGVEAQTTPLFLRTDKLEGLSGSSELVQQAFNLLEGDLSDVVEVGGVYYLFQVDQRQAPQVPELEVVSEQVKEDLTLQMREEKARTEAEAFLKALLEGATFDTAAKRKRGGVITSDYFKRQDSVPAIGNEPEISQKAFLLSSDNRIAAEVIKGVEGYYVVRLEDRRQPAEDAFAGEKVQTTMQLMQLKKEDAFSAWLSAMKAESEITRDERFLK